MATHGEKSRPPVGRTSGRLRGESHGRRHGTIRRWCGRVVGDPLVAGDLTAETFARALEARKRFRDQAGGSALPWLFGIAHNLVRQHRRTRRVESSARRRLGLPLDLSFEDVDDIAERVDAGRVTRELEEALMRLPENQRQAVVLRYFDDLAFPDIAARLGCSDTNARVRVSRALTSLRLRMKENNA